MEDKNLETQRYKAAQKRVKDIKGFYIHLLVYLFVNIALIVVQSRNDSFIDAITDLSNYTTALFWGIGLAAHWAGVFGSVLMLGKDWEERKIKELMNKELQERKKWE